MRERVELAAQEALANVRKHAGGPERTGAARAPRRGPAGRTPRWCWLPGRSGPATIRRHDDGRAGRIRRRSSTLRDRPAPAEVEDGPCPCPAPRRCPGQLGCLYTRAGRRSPARPRRSTAGSRGPSPRPPRPGDDPLEGTARCWLLRESRQGLPTSRNSLGSSSRRGTQGRDQTPGLGRRSSG
jgi:hypothetical protein